MKTTETSSPQALIKEAEQLARRIGQWQPGLNAPSTREYYKQTADTHTSNLKTWSKLLGELHGNNSEAALQQANSMLGTKTPLTLESASQAVQQELAEAINSTKSSKLYRAVRELISRAKDEIPAQKSSASMLSRAFKQANKIHKSIAPKDTASRMAFGAAEFFLGQMAVMTGVEQIGLAINGTKQIQRQQIDANGNRMILITPEPLPALERVVRALVGVPAVGLGAAAVGFGARSLFLGR